MANLGPIPEVNTSAGWGQRPRSLNSASAMQRLTTNHWAEADASLNVLQRAALLQRVLDRPESSVRVTGLSALGLYNLPVGTPDPSIDQFLKHAPAPRANAYFAQSSTPHLAWAGTRRKCNPDTALMTKSYGLRRRVGPWGCLLADPLEALLVAAPYLSRWRITACADALLSCHLVTPKGKAYPPYSRSLVNDTVKLFPPTSHNMRRFSAALKDAAERTWSPMETLTRLIAVSGGAPAPVMNFKVILDRMTRYVDVAWPEEKVALEYNGAVHLNRKAYGDELFRRQRLLDHGWRIRYVVWEDLTQPRRRALWLEWLTHELGKSQSMKGPFQT